MKEGERRKEKKGRPRENSIGAVRKVGRAKETSGALVISIKQGSEDRLVTRSKDRSRGGASGNPRPWAGKPKPGGAELDGEFIRNSKNRPGKKAIPTPRVAVRLPPCTGVGFDTRNRFERSRRTPGLVSYKNGSKEYVLYFAGTMSDLLIAELIEQDSPTREAKVCQILRLVAHIEMIERSRTSSRSDT